MAIVKMKPSSIIVFVLYDYHNMYNIISWKKCHSCINCTLFKKPRNISFELVIDKYFFPEYVREVYPLLGDDEKNGFEVTLDA